jgi:hypothetical protein
MADQQERWRRYWDKHSASYDKQMRFFDRYLCSATGRIGVRLHRLW